MNSAGYVPKGAPMPDTINARQWDNAQEYAWKEHGMITFHYKDGRMWDVLRALAVKYMTWKYGARV